MKTFLSLMTASLILLSACSDNTDNGSNEDVVATKAETTSQDSAYNADLAKELEADPYGMHSYVFVTLLTGPNDATITDEAERAELFKGHFDMIGRLAEEGKLVLAGPFVEAGEKRGLYIFDVDTIAEAQELVKTDPSIQAGIFRLEFDKYYGSAALKKVNDIHMTIAEQDI